MHDAGVPAASASFATTADPVASTSTSTAESVVPPRTSLGRFGLPYDTVPTPLPTLGQATKLAQHTAFPASSVVEQLTILEACLATGNLARAKKIFSSVRAIYDTERRHRLSENVKTLQLFDIVPVSVHTTFLRTMFRQALVHGSNTHGRGFQTRKKAYASEAWEWFEMILREEKIHGRLEDAAWAVMLKGLVATNLTSSPNRVADPAAPFLQSIAQLYSLMRAHHRSLEHILADPIFSHAGLAGLNQHPALECIDELMNVLAAGNETDALAEVEEVRFRLTEDVRYRTGESSTSQGAGAEGSISQAATPIVDPLADVERLQPARRSENAEMPFRLASLLGNLDTITGQRLVTTDANARQELLEESAYDAARWQKMHDVEQLNKLNMSTDIKLKQDNLQVYMHKWLEALILYLEVALSSLPQEKEGGNILASDDDVKTVLQLMDIRKLAFVTVVETMRNLGNTSTAEGSKATRAIVVLGRAIEDEVGAEAWKTLYPEVYENAMTAITHHPQVAIRKFMMEQGKAAGAARFAALEGYGDEVPDEIHEIRDEAERAAKLAARQRAMPWTQKLRAKVGGFLIKAFLDVAEIERIAIDENGKKVREMQPAIYQSYQYLRGNKVGVIKLNPAISARLDKDNIGTFVFPRYLPMLVPPVPWTKWNSGGYIIHPTGIMRTGDSPEQKAYVKAASDQGHLSQIYAALDVLGNTAWQINRPIYDVISKVWNSGESIADIPQDLAESSIADPPVPEEVDVRDPKFREAYRLQLKEAKSARSKAHSQRCTVNYKLEIARAYLGETFYFPHNVDFRGRAYPIPPNLSHIGDDMSRGLLIFAEGRKLGARGLTWLRIQIANTAGYDKASFADREEFSKENVDLIMDSADNPLDGKRWWLKADEPWQCLAACMELTNALRSPVPEDYVSHLPVQQDGTCNGLQHYAALGGDKTGASQVNLAKGDKPADVYTAVANLVNKVIANDLLTGTDAKKAVAAVLQGKVTRKVVKQTVMTTVYGVTFIGAKRQIQRQLKDRGDISPTDLFAAATYLAENVLSCIGDLFQGASSIQLWLSLCARLIGKSVRLEEGKSIEAQFREPMASVIWTTPLGLPIAQPYRKIKKSQIVTALQTVFISDPNTPTAIDARAQATAFPPNFIHSLDASHMMLTAIECKRRGLNFASVHDSYWTHACDVDEMSTALRDCFVELHSRDLLGDLKRDFEARYAGMVVRKSNTTMAASALNNQIRSKGADSASHRLDLQAMAKNLGSASTLPPLAVAAEKQLFDEATKAALAAGEDDASLEEAEEALFDDDFEDSPESDQAEVALTATEAEAEAPPVKRGRGRPPKNAPKIIKAVKAKKAKVKKTKKAGKAVNKPIIDDNNIEGTKYGKTVTFPLTALLPDVPPRGDFDLNKVRESPYFFS